MRKFIGQLVLFSFLSCFFLCSAFTASSNGVKAPNVKGKPVIDIKSKENKKAILVSTKTVTLKLVDIVVKKTSEKSGDELYFTVDVHKSSKDKAPKYSHTRIPDAPMHWLSSYINKIKDLTIWEGTLDKGQSVNLVVSLMEEDAPPFDLDDLLGDFKINLENKDGQIISKWTIPNTGRTPYDSPDKNNKNNKIKKVILNNDGAVYLLTLKLIDK